MNIMAERERIRFIKEEPVLARTLRAYYFGLMPKEIHEWAFDWWEDIGSIMRSRDFMAYTASQLMLFIGLDSLSRLLGVKAGTVLAKVFEGLGIRVS